jgi:hypothetical protein
MKPTLCSLALLGMQQYCSANTRELALAPPLLGSSAPGSAPGSAPPLLGSSAPPLFDYSAPRLLHSSAPPLLRSSASILYPASPLTRLLHSSVSLQ